MEHVGRNRPSGQSKGNYMDITTVDSNLGLIEDPPIYYPA